MSQLLPLPAGGGPMGPGGIRAYRLRDTVLGGGVARSEREIFDGVDTSLRSLVRFAGANAPADLGTRLDAIAATVVEARKALAAGSEADAAPPLARGLKAVRDLRGALTAIDQAARYEIDFRLAQKEDQFEQALLLAADVRLDAIARDGLVPAGHPVSVQLIAARRGNVPVTVSMNTNGLTPINPEDTRACSGELATGGSHATCTSTLTVPADARVTAAHFRNAPQGARYVFDPDVPFGWPFRPTPFTATFNHDRAAVNHVPMCGRRAIPSA